MRLKKLHIIIVAYGEWHLNLFEKILIPNLCGLVTEIPDELRTQTKLRIFTRKENADQIRGVLSRVKLDTSLTCEIIPEVAPPTSNNPYPEMNRMHQIALKDAAAEDAPLFFMFPDQILSKGTLRTILQAAEEGFRLVTFPSVRIKLEPMLPILNEKVQKHPQHFLYEEPRSLVKTILPHFHQLLTDMFWDAYDKEEVSAAHYAVMWNVGERGFMVRGFHNYVAFAWPANRRSDYEYSIDVHFIKKSVKDFSQICMIDDSDKAFAFDLSNEDRRHLGKMQASSRAERLLKVADNRDMFTDYHLRTTLTICRIHTGDFDEKWFEEEKKFDRATTHIFLYILLKRFLLSRRKVFVKKWQKIVEKIRNLRQNLIQQDQKFKDRIKMMFSSISYTVFFKNFIARAFSRAIQAKSPKS